MRHLLTVLAGLGLVAAPVSAIAQPDADPELAGEAGLAANQFVTDAALSIVFRIEAGQMAAELARDEDVRVFAESLVTAERDAALALTEAAHAAGIEADALERLQTHHPEADAEGRGTLGDRNFARARDASHDVPGGASRTGSPEAPGAAQWSATQAGQRIERRLEALQDSPPDGFDQTFRDLIREDLDESRARLESGARELPPTLAAHAEDRLPILHDHARDLAALGQR